MEEHKELWVSFFPHKTWSYLVVFFVMNLCHQEITVQGNEVETGVVELGFVCDMEFSKRFSFDRDRISEFVALLVQDAQVTYQTLKITKLLLEVSSIMIISNVSGQPFVEVSRKSNGTTDLSHMHEEFGRWVYKEDISSKSDIVVLITGSAGAVWWLTEHKTACKVETGKVNKIISYRSDSQDGHPRLKLSHPIARLLGAENSDAACQGKLWFFDFSGYKPPKSYYFASCNDIAIYTFVQSVNASCLKLTNRFNHNAVILKQNTLLADDLCKTEYGGYPNITTRATQDICASVSMCYQQDTLIGRVYSLYNTNCGANKFCFRGRCLPTGSILRHHGSSLCLYTSDVMKLYLNLTVRKCKTSSYRFDEVMFNTTHDGGVVIVATHNDVSTPDKCLTVNEQTSKVVFGFCHAGFSRLLTWDILELDMNQNGFILCLRGMLKCATVNDNNELVLTHNPDLQNPSMHWILQQNSYSENELPIQKHPVIVTFYQPLKITIRLGVVCDYECGKIFRNNIPAIENYWKFMIHDAYSKFRPIRNLEVDFVVTEKLFLFESSCQALQLTSNNQYSNGTIKDLNKLFDAYLAAYTNITGKVDVVLVTTGKKVQGNFSVKKGAWFCADDTSTKQSLGTVVLKIAAYSNNPCEDLANGLKLLFEPKAKLTTLRSENCTNTECGKNRDGHSSFTYCVAERMTTFFHENIKRFAKKDIQVASVISVVDYSTQFPSFVDQCGGYGKDRNVFKTGPESCASTNCYISAIHTKKLFHVGTIRPVYKTPCGTNKHCVLGRCISKGFQLHHISSGKCINGKNLLLSPFIEPVQLVDCLLSPFITEELTVEGIVTDGFQMSIHRFHFGGLPPNKMCLSVSEPENVLQSERCENEPSDKQLWDLLRTHDNDSSFLLYHHGTAKCVSVDSNLNFVFESTCDIMDQRMLWRYFNSSLSARDENRECSGKHSTENRKMNFPEEDLEASTNYNIFTSSAATEMSFNEGTEIEGPIFRKSTQTDTWLDGPTEHSDNPTITTTETPNTVFEEENFNPSALSKLYVQ